MRVRVIARARVRVLRPDATWAYIHTYIVRCTRMNTDTHRARTFCTCTCAHRKRMRMLTQIFLGSLCAQAHATCLDSVTMIIIIVDDDDDDLKDKRCARASENLLHYTLPWWWLLVCTQQARAFAVLRCVCTRCTTYVDFEWTVPDFSRQR